MMKNRICSVCNKVKPTRVVVICDDCLSSGEGSRHVMSAPESCSEPARAGEEQGAVTSSHSAPESDSVLAEIIKQFTERRDAAKRQQEYWEQKHDQSEAVLWREESITWTTAILLAEKISTDARPAVAERAMARNEKLSHALGRKEQNAKSNRQATIR